jgi:hypothetical protein
MPAAAQRNHHGNCPGMGGNSSGSGSSGSGSSSDSTASPGSDV